MRAPPAVSVDARPGVGWRLTQAMLCAGAATALLLWATAWLDRADVGAPLAFVAAVVAAALGWHFSAAADTRLTWSGTAWSMARAGREPVVVRPPQVMLDLGGWLLLRLQPEVRGRRVWLPVARVDGAAWHLLRAAVYSAAPDPAPRSDAEPPPF